MFYAVSLLSFLQLKLKGAVIRSSVLLCRQYKQDISQSNMSLSFHEKIMKLSSLSLNDFIQTTDLPMALESPTRNDLRLCFKQTSP